LGREGQPLTAVGVRTLSMPRLQLAVLAACESFGGRSTRGQGPMSLARALLQAGGPVGVANRWPGDDRASGPVAAAVPTAYSTTPAAAAALRHGKMLRAHSDDAQLRPPSAWAGWVVIGGIPWLRPEPFDARP